MKVRGQHQAPSHLNSSHSENRILHVSVIILNEVTYVWFTTVLFEVGLLKICLPASLVYIVFPPSIHKRRSRIWAIISSEQCLSYKLLTGKVPMKTNESKDQMNIREGLTNITGSLNKDILFPGWYLKRIRPEHWCQRRSWSSCCQNFNCYRGSPADGIELWRCREVFCRKVGTLLACSIPVEGYRNMYRPKNVSSSIACLRLSYNVG
jgi:hypothetical protein